MPGGGEKPSRLGLVTATLLVGVVLTIFLHSVPTTIAPNNATATSNTTSAGDSLPSAFTETTYSLAWGAIFLTLILVSLCGILGAGEQDGATAEEGMPLLGERAVALLDSDAAQMDLEENDNELTPVGLI